MPIGVYVPQSKPGILGLWIYKVSLEDLKNPVPAGNSKL